MKKAFIIIPTYNERENIAKIIPILVEVFKKIKNWQMGILVVDDSSPDKTYDVVKELQKKYKQLELIINKQKSGLGGAYLKGMKHAFGELKADLVFEFDADLSHDPQKIPDFLKKIDEGYDMVLGSRYIKGGGIPANWGVHRKFLSVVGNIIIMTVLTDFRIRDWTTGYRAINRAVYEAVHRELTSERFTGYTFQIGFLYNTVRRGFKVAEVPFVFVDRTIGSSKMGPEYIKNTLLYIFKVRLLEILNNRLFKFVMVGGIGFLVQMLALILYRRFIPYQIAQFFSMETAVVSNFILSNLWTFADRKLAVKDIPFSFAKFNLASFGSLAIQQLIALFGEFVIGLFALFTLPIINFTVDTGIVYSMLGVFIGMFWNFFAYNKFVWKKDATSKIS
jgi:dolichol-phosphate mannosyltransferase